MDKIFPPGHYASLLEKKFSGGPSVCWTFWRFRPKPVQRYGVFKCARKPLFLKRKKSVIVTLLLRFYHVLSRDFWIFFYIHPKPSKFSDFWGASITEKGTHCRFMEKVGKVFKNTKNPKRLFYQGVTCPFPVQISSFLTLEKAPFDHVIPQNPKLRINFPKNVHVGLLKRSEIIGKKWK